VPTSNHASKTATRDTADRPRLLVIGTGVLGGYLLDLLTWVGFPGDVVVGGRDVERMTERVNLSRLAGLNQGTEPNLEVVPIDLDDIDRTSETIAAVQPDIVFNATSVQTYWKISTLPAPVYQRLSAAGVGPWTPMHLSTALGLMQAVRASGCTPHVVNAAYPDAVNPALATCGLAPTVGIGNVMNIVPAIRSAVAIERGIPTGPVTIRMAAHHYVGNRLPAAGDAGGAPFLVRVYIDGLDRTDEFDLARTLALLPTAVRRTRGKAGMYVTASSAYAVLRALASHEETSVHAPGPLGLIGGYPIIASSAGVRLDLPAEWTREQALDVNRRGQVWDGISSISPDGRIALTDLAVSTMSDVLGHDCPEFTVAEAPAVARAIQERYQALARRCDRDLALSA